MRIDVSSENFWKQARAGDMQPWEGREQGVTLERNVDLVIRVARTTDFTDFTERIRTMITDGASTCQVSAPGDATYSQSVQSVKSVVFIFLSRVTDFSELPARHPGRYGVVTNHPKIQPAIRNAAHDVGAAELFRLHECLAGGVTARGQPWQQHPVDQAALPCSVRWAARRRREPERKGRPISFARPPPSRTALPRACRSRWRSRW